MASSSSNNSYEGKILKRAKPSTIQDKFMVGYQGWFTCPGDGEPVGAGHHGWLHWFDAPIPDGGHPNTDLWPDVSEYSPSELFPAPGLKTKSGDPVFLFSSRNAKTVQRHFHWMAEHGVDGVFLQRFAGQCDIEGGQEGIRRIRDEVGDRVREAAEREGRVFAIMYDVTGVAPDRLKRILEHDWGHLVRNKGVLDSPNYLKEKGKPVIALWGFGFDNAKHTPELVHSIVQFFRDTTPGGVYIMAGTPASWRTAEGDADRNPHFLNVWMSDFDAISPWTVGRYTNDQEADQFMEEKMRGDVELIKQHNEKGTGRKIDYIPVVLPGGSGYNMSQGHWGFNNIKRRGGRFLWKQIFNAKRLGVRTIYGAMWDEYDEGTAFMPVVESKRSLPESEKFRFMALDEDGYDCPPDWYMRICGFAAEGLRSERQIHDTFPGKELQDYWSSRPKFEEVSQKSGDFISGAIAGGSGSGAGGSGEGEGQTYQEWLAAQKDDKEDLPPPPYTLMEDEDTPQRTAPTRAPTQSVPVIASTTPTTTLPPNTSPTTSHVPQGASHSYGPAIATAAPVSDIPARPGHHADIHQPHQHQQRPAQQQYYQPDSVGSLAHDFSRVSVSGEQNAATPATGGRDDYFGGGMSAGALSSPVHSTYPVNQNPTPAPHPPQLSLLQNLSRPQSRPPSRPQSSRPQSQTRPAPHQQTPPHSPGYQSSYGPPTTAPMAPTASAPEQWPPASWNLNSNQPASSAPPQQSATPNATSYGHTTGGANLSRPNSYKASGYGATGPGLRPPVNPLTRPTSQPVVSAPANSSPWAANQPGPNAVSQRPTSPHSPTSYNNNGAYPHSGGYKPSGRQSSLPESSQDYNMPHFPDPSRPGYYPPRTNYSGQGESAYPGQHGASSYQPPQGSNYTSWPTAPSVSPAPGPLGASAYSAPPSRPYSPPQAAYPQQYAGSSYPFNPPPQSMPALPPTEAFDAQGGGRPYQFPQAPGGEGGYYGGAGGDMPASSSFSSAYPTRYDMPSSGYPSGGAQPYPQQQDPWVPGGGASNMPPLPPRPPAHYSASAQAKPSSSSTGSTALGYALTAVDKFAGRKTRDQIESQVENLAQTGNKLFSKFTNK